MKYIKLLFVVAMIPLLSECHGCGTQNGNENMTVVMKECVRHYPYSKELFCKLYLDGKQVNTYIVANFYMNKITSLAIFSVREDDIAQRTLSKETLCKINYETKMSFLENTLCELSRKYGISSLRQIYLKSDLWGDASVEISEAYFTRKSKSSFCNKDLNGIVSSSGLFRDMNATLKHYGLFISGFDFEEVVAEERSNFLDLNKTNYANLPKFLLSCDITFEVKAQ